MAYRAVDPTYSNVDSRGQIEIGIYSRTASTLSEWVANDSRPPLASENVRYATAGANQMVLTVDCRDGLFFDWIPIGGPPIEVSPLVHATAVFLGTAYVLVLDWWSTDPAYAPTLELYHQQMVYDFHSSSTQSN
jgi:hypothetical protein